VFELHQCEVVERGRDGVDFYGPSEAGLSFGQFAIGDPTPSLIETPLRFEIGDACYVLHAIGPL
jgi:hypothetical protein